MTRRLSTSEALQIPAVAAALKAERETTVTAKSVAVPGTSGAGPTKAKARQPDRHAMNKNEAAYSRYLETLKTMGDIAAWVWSPFKLRLGSDWKTTLTVDFMVIHHGGEIELVDCKGRTKRKDGRETFWCEEDSKVKLKVAAEQYPWFEFVIVWQQKDGTWGRMPL